MTMTMKKFFSLLAIMVSAALSLISCDEDVAISNTLSGDWKGNFGMYYDYYDRHGKYVETFDCYDSDIRFLPDYEYATHGIGYQVDYYDFGPYRRMYHTFDWDVRNENIYLHYHGESEYDTVIRDFRMTNRYFEGYFSNGSEKFKLVKISDFYWDSHWGDYGYDYYDDWYGFAPTRSGAANDSIPADLEGGTIRLGNRFAK